ncbi:MAG: acyl-CoA dehydrogenase family protein [Alphaproteobacteria bacterium]|nr:acyl-CoA dehydrogenase family protein [Alphaproteobacteria bacterium]
MTFYGTTEEHEMFAEMVNRFVEEELRPQARDFDAAGRVDRAVFRRMGELGLLGLRYDPAYGGQGLDARFSAILADALGRADNLGGTTSLLVHTDMATPSLHRFGSEALKQQFLVPAIAGEMVSAIAVTEPDAGSDVARIATRAVRDGDDWVINGSKLYITNAATADWLCLLAVTDPSAGHRGFSQIIVPTGSRGLSVHLLEKIGFHGSDTGQVFLEDVRVPVSNTIGEVGHGFQQQMMQFQDERLYACIALVSCVELLWEETKQWAQQRELFGKPLSSMQNTQFRLVEMLAETTASKHLLKGCVDALAEGRDATDLISIAKLFTCRSSRKVADTCFQLHGGAGYMRESMAGRVYVDARIASIGGGSDETMMHYVARRLGL